MIISDLQIARPLLIAAGIIMIIWGVNMILWRRAHRREIRRILDEVRSRKRTISLIDEESV